MNALSLREPLLCPLLSLGAVENLVKPLGLGLAVVVSRREIRDEMKVWIDVNTFGRGATQGLEPLMDDWACL